MNIGKKIAVFVSLTLIASVLAIGCGKKNAEVAPTKEEVGSQEIEQASPEVKEEVKEDTAKVMYEMPAEAVGAPVVKLADTAYFVGSKLIMSLDVNTGETDIVWEAKDSNSDYTDLANGNAVLLYDKLYFFTSDYVGDTFKGELNMLNLDNGESSVVASFDSDCYGSGFIYYRNGVMYVDADNKDDVYKVNETGDITEVLSRSSIDQFNYAMDDRSYIHYVSKSGQMAWSEDIADKYGKVVKSADGEQALCDIANSKETGLGGSVLAANDDVLLIYSSDDDNTCYYGTINLKTGEYTFLEKGDSYKNVIAIDDKFAYYYDNSVNWYDADFYKINLSNGKETELCKVKAPESRLDEYSVTSFGPVIIDGYLYMAESHDYAIFPQVVNLETGESVIGNKSCYDSGITEFGTIVRKEDNVDAPNGTRLISANTSVLKLDSKFAGAGKINEFFASKAEEVLGQVQDSLEEVKNMQSDWGEDEPYFPGYSFDYKFTSVEYFDGHTMCVVYDSYDYYGGAHGMPYKFGYMFNVDTGDMYSLTDLVTIPEEEFNEVVVNAFVDMMNENAEIGFWDNAEEYVRMAISFSYDNCYLTEDGMLFFFPPYDLASYAAGFQTVTVPYDALGIDLSNIGAKEEEETEVAE